jgi:hypothetical protein
MDNENVLTVTEDGKLIHIGDPMSFNSELLVEYCRRGCKIETFTIDEFNLSGWKLYEIIPAAKEYWEGMVMDAIRTELSEANQALGIANGFTDDDYKYIGVVAAAFKRLSPP